MMQPACRNAVARRSVRGREPLAARDEEAVGDARGERFGVLQSERAQDAAAANERRAARCAGRTSAAAPRRASAPCSGRARPISTARPSRAHHERAGACARTICVRAGSRISPVLDARRADRLARAAVQTLGHLVDEARAEQIEPLFGDRLDQRDAPARARRLDQRFDIGRTGRQAQPAADAAVEDVRRRNIGAEPD